MTLLHMTREDAWDFMTYMNVADEIWPHSHNKGSRLTLDDLTKESVAVSEKVAGKFHLPFPPDLACAESFLLDHGPQVRFLLDSTPGQDIR